MKKNDQRKKSPYSSEKDFTSFTTIPAISKPQTTYAIYSPLCKDNLVSKYISQEGRPPLSSFKSPAEMSFPIQRQSRQFNDINEKKGKKLKKKSIYKGVFTCGKKFKAQIQAFGVQHYLGLYKTAEEAARSYDSHARMMLGSKAKTNFQYEAPIVPLQEKKLTKKDKNLKRIYVGIKRKKFRYNYPSKQFYLTKEKLETIGNFLNYFGYKLLPANQCSIVNHTMSHGASVARLGISRESLSALSSLESEAIRAGLEGDAMNTSDNHLQVAPPLHATSTYSSMNFLLNLPSHTVIRYNSLPIPSNAIAVSNNLNYFNLNQFIYLKELEEKCKGIDRKIGSIQNYFFQDKRKNLTSKIYSKYMKKSQSLDESKETEKVNSASENVEQPIQARNDSNKSTTFAHPVANICSSISSLSILHCVNQPYYELSSSMPSYSDLDFDCIPKLKSL